MKSIEEVQKELCSRFGADYQSCDMNLKLGISANAKDGGQPVHGLRIKAENGTNGWYIWIGDWSDDPDFFVPLHGLHLTEWCAIAIPYLGLPEGWRFLVAEDYEDAWEDQDILKGR